MTKRRKHCIKERGVLRHDCVFAAFYLEGHGNGASVHCGDVIAIRIGDRYTWGRVETDSNDNWYVTFSDSAGKHETLFMLCQGAFYEMKI